MGIAHHLFAEGRIGDGALVAGLLVLAFLIGPRVYGRLRIPRERLLILGTSPMSRLVIEEVARRPRRYAAVTIVNDVTDLGRVIEERRPDRIVIGFAERRGRLPLCWLVESRARGIRIEDVAETYERLTGKLPLELLPPSRVIFSTDFPAARVQPLVARIVSFLVAVVGLIVLAPILGVIALLIKLDSAGPVFFVQPRAGRFGKPFHLVKFRTMRPGDRPRSEWEQDNSHRITRSGRWLRRFRLDELPQLVNVLRGDMNIVGPRPHPMSNLALLILAARNLSEVSGDAIPFYALRCSVRPGITGWAQVRYRYANSLEQEVEKIRYDVYYLKHRSCWLDVKILFETVRIVLSGHRPAADGNEEPQSSNEAAVLPRSL